MCYLFTNYCYINPLNEGASLGEGNPLHNWIFQRWYFKRSTSILRKLPRQATGKSRREIT